MQIGLHHNHVEGLINAAEPFKQRREERHVPQLGDLQVQITRYGRQGPGPGTVELGRARLGTFERVG